jgi:hypothetical protein
MLPGEEGEPSSPASQQSPTAVSSPRLFTGVISSAIGIGTVDQAVHIVVDTVGAGLSLALSADRPSCRTSPVPCTIGIGTVDQVVTVIVEVIRTGLAFSLSAAGRAGGIITAVGIVTIDCPVAIIVYTIVTDFHGPRIDGRVLVITIDGAAGAAPVDVKAIAVTVRTGRASAGGRIRTKITRIVPRVPKCLSIRIERSTAAGVYVAETTAIIRSARGVHSVEVGSPRLGRLSQDKEYRNCDGKRQN